MHHDCYKRDMKRAFRAAMAAKMASGRWDGGGVFGPDGPFGPSGPFGPGGPFGRSGPFGSGGPGGFGGRGRRGRMFGQGELRLVLLKLVADEPRHGYELRKAIEEMTGGGYAPSPGALYPTLIALADEGLLIEQEVDTTVRKLYAVTDLGRAELAEKADEVEAVFTRLTEHGEKQHSQKPPPHLFRAMGNLAQVLKNKARSGGLDEDALNGIVDMIDEMAKRIERL